MDIDGVQPLDTKQEIQVAHTKTPRRRRPFLLFSHFSSQTAKPRKFRDLCGTFPVTSRTWGFGMAEVEICKVCRELQGVPQGLKPGVGGL